MIHRHVRSAQHDPLFKLLSRFTPITLIALALFFALASQQEAAAAPEATPVLYGVDGTAGNLNAMLYQLNPNNGAVIQVIGKTGVALTGLAVDPTTGILYGSRSRCLRLVPAPVNAPRSNHEIVTGGCPGERTGELYRVNKNTGLATLIGSYGVTSLCAEGEDRPETMADLAFNASGQLFGWSESVCDDLYRINKATGLATKVGESGLSTQGSGLEFCGGKLYLTGDDPDGNLTTINSFNGAATAGPTLSNLPLAKNVNALTCLNGVLYGSNAGNDQAVDAAHLITINTATGQATDLGRTVNGLDAIAFDIAPPAPTPAPSPTHAVAHTPTPVAPPAEVPEADTLVLFGSGASTFGSYLLYRWRQRRKR